MSRNSNYFLYYTRRLDRIQSELSGFFRVPGYLFNFFSDELWLLLSRFKQTEDIVNEVLCHFKRSEKSLCPRAMERFRIHQVVWNNKLKNI